MKEKSISKGRQVSVYLSPEHLYWIGDLSITLKRSRSWVLSMILDYYIDRNIKIEEPKL
jgi:hypothetical protein